MGWASSSIGERGGPFSHMCMLCAWCAEPTQLISNTHHAPTPSTDYLQASPKALERGALCKCGPQTPPPTPLTAVSIVLGPSRHAQTPLASALTHAAAAGGANCRPCRDCSTNPVNGRYGGCEWWASTRWREWQARRGEIGWWVMCEGVRLRRTYDCLAQ